MVDFTEALNKPAAAVEKPKPKPTGSYLAMIQGMPKQKTVKVQGEEKPVISFSCKLMAPKEDVDADDLAALPDLATWPPLNRDIWLEGEQGEYALKQFLTLSLGIDPGDRKNSKTLGQMCAEAAGKQLIVTLKHRPFTNKENEMEIATEIGATAAA